ncbi:MAG TPA: hypothetical protein VLA74_09260 [Nitrososphaeraceae archaeon]|nr:hypothetical protein [Nitrososphaeraceae archaeon]
MYEIIIIPQKEGKKLNCQRCGHFWIYTGLNQFICSCPHCRTTITINKKNKKNPLHDEVRVGGSAQHAMVIENHTNGCDSYG